MKKILTIIAAAALTIAPLHAEEGEPLSLAESAAYTPELFSTLTAALVTTDLAGTLNNDGDFTVFAPTNEAFDHAAVTILGEYDENGDPITGLDLLLALDKETLTEILLYHVVPGSLDSGAVLAAGTLTTLNESSFDISGTSIIDINGNPTNLDLDNLNIQAANGIIHVIDRVLLTPVKEEPVSIYETAVATPALSSLVAAIDKAGLAYILSNDNYSFTVFAPTNDAFDAAARAALGDENATGGDLVEALSAWQLRRILLNHVIWREYDSDAVLDRTRFYTLGWGKLTRENLTLTSRNGVGTLIPELLDIEATNGIVHVIDGVLLP